MRLLIIGIYLIVCIVGLQQYIQWTSAAFILGMIALPVTTEFNRSVKGGFRFFRTTILFFTLFLLLPVNTFLYLSVAAALLFFAETFIGRINLLPQLVILIMAPWAGAFVNLFSFPVRLQLSIYAGKLLSLIDKAVTVEGNVITCAGQSFSVDPACMGLQMMITSLLCGLLVLGLYQKKLQKALKNWQVLILLVLIIPFNIIANLFRIVLLVQFRIMPENPLHEIMGILCLLTYVFVPLLVSIPWLVERYGKPVSHHQGTYYVRQAGRLFAANYLLAGCMLSGMFHLKPEGEVRGDVPVVNGYQASLLPGHVIKLENNHSLVYVKQIPDYYYTEHHPMICWKGSGYEFQEIRQVNDVYTARLQQGKHTLYTAWWYANGVKSTISQIDWRWDVFKGAHPYSLVNVTATDPEQLAKEINAIRGLHSFPF